jgi:peptidoglycan/xylan/chitin deacetylase (PgdA/CDA1 family)
MKSRGLMVVVAAAVAAAWGVSTLPPLRLAVNHGGPRLVAAAAASAAPALDREEVAAPSPAAAAAQEIVRIQVPPEDASPIDAAALEARPELVTLGPAQLAAEEAVPFARSGKIVVVAPAGPRAVEMPILVYHTIKPGPVSGSAAARLLTESPDAFEQQLKYLKDNGYQTISFTQLCDFLEKGTPIPERPAIISFDDGWDNQFAYAFPLLQKYGFTATFFVVTNYLDHQNFMKIEQLKTMIAAGMSIGSHSRSHPALAGIGNPRRLWDEIAGSKAFLEEQLGVTIDTFAYPYGSYNAGVAALVKAAGYRTARTVNFGTRATAGDLEVLAGLTFPIYVSRYRERVETATSVVRQ